MQDLRIQLDAELRDPRIAAFLEEHLADMRRASPPESVHALDLGALRQPGIRFWTAWLGETLVATAALKHLDQQHAELKSMRTTAALRGQRIAAGRQRAVGVGDRRRDAAALDGAVYRIGMRVSGRFVDELLVLAASGGFVQILGLPGIGVRRGGRSVGCRIGARRICGAGARRGGTGRGRA